MSARRKLNAAYWNGALLIAGVIGALTQSWTVFGIALLGMVITNIVLGNIRPRRQDRK